MSDENDPVPIFGTWRAIYTAVMVSTVLVMALIALFTVWPY